MFSQEDSYRALRHYGWWKDNAYVVSEKERRESRF